MTTYRAFPSTNGPASPAAYSGNFICAVAFVLTNGAFFDGYWFWCCNSGQGTGPVKCALWSWTGQVTGAGGPITYTLVPGSTVTSGTLTAGTWNYIPLAAAKELATGIPYIAAIGWVSSTGFPDNVGQYASGGSLYNGITNGILNVYGSAGSTNANPIGGFTQGMFSTAGSDPSTTGPPYTQNGDNFWVDVQIDDQPPSGYSSSYRLWPTLTGATADYLTQLDNNVDYVLATEIHLSQACTANNIWFYSPSGTAQLPTQIDIWTPSGTTGTNVYSHLLPTWSGAAGSGWISTPVTAPATTPPVGGYIGWWDASQITSPPADGGNLSSWNDLSGNSRTLTQATGTRQPVYYSTTTAKLMNGLPAVWFNGAQVMATASFTQAQPYTVFVVCQQTAASGTNVVVSSNSSTVYIASNSTQHWVATTGGTVFTTTFAIGGNAQVAAAVFNAGSSTFTQNSTTQSGTLGSTTLSSAFSVGAMAAGTNFWTGPVSEVILYPSALSSTQIGQVSAYLQNKWMLPSATSLAAGSYKVSVYNGAATPDAWSAKRLGYWGGTGSGNNVAPNGITIGPMYAPPSSLGATSYSYGVPTAGLDGTTLTETGQSTFKSGPPSGYPNQYVGTNSPGGNLYQNYWVDLEVTPLGGFIVGASASLVYTASAGRIDRTVTGAAGQVADTASPGRVDVTMAAGAAGQQVYTASPGTVVTLLGTAAQVVYTASPGIVGGVNLPGAAAHVAYTASPGLAAITIPGATGTVIYTAGAGTFTITSPGSVTVAGTNGNVAYAGQTGTLVITGNVTVGGVAALVRLAALVGATSIVGPFTVGRLTANTGSSPGTLTSGSVPTATLTASDI